LLKQKELNKESEDRMNWKQLLNHDRLGNSNQVSENSVRTAFQRDYDRIIFSTAFRRLQDKTQVFPLAQSSFVRTRLTHSLEVSCVGRTLGTSVGDKLIQQDKTDGKYFHPSQLGAIVATACLAHDIGNPPFGHAGEAAINHWFATDSYGKEIIEQIKKDGSCATDFTSFEGNAQGFRILCRLQHPEQNGGMQLTYASLAAFQKYPRGSDTKKPKMKNIACKKHGYFADDKLLLEEVAQKTGMKPLANGGFVRHPLAFLVEAADDICYHIIDIEDAFKLKILDFDEVVELFRGVITNGSFEEGLNNKREMRNSQVEFLRAKAIGSLIKQTIDVFLENYKSIMAGEFREALTDKILRATEFKRLITVASKHVYSCREVALVESAGYSVLGRLIEMFLRAMNDRVENKDKLSRRSKTLLNLLPNNCYSKKYNLSGLSLYERTLIITDYVSGMSDSEAVLLFKRLTGISLANEF